MHSWKDRVRAAFLGAARTPADDIVEELAQHARSTYETARADGSTVEEAEARVTELLHRWRTDAGSLERRSQRVDAVIPPPVAGAPSRFAGLAQDVRYAARLVGRQPRHALITILTMAIGIGATTVLFSVTYGVLMRPLPWPHADRIVVLKETRGGFAPRFGAFTNAAYLAWRPEPATIEHLAAWSQRVVTITGTGDPERIRITAASATLFAALGVRPLIGSLFEEKDEASPVAVLSETLWRQRFGGDPAVLGRLIQLDGESYTAIGVLPDAQAYPDRQTRAIVPYAVRPDGRKLPGGVQRRGGVASGRHRGPGCVRRDGARAIGGRHRADDHGHLRQQRSRGDHGTASSRCADRRRSATAPRAAGRRRPAARDRHSQRGQPSTRSHDYEEPRDGHPRGAGCGRRARHQAAARRKPAPRPERRRSRSRAHVDSPSLSAISSARRLSARGRPRRRRDGRRLRALCLGGHWHPVRTSARTPSETARHRRGARRKRNGACGRRRPHPDSPGTTGNHDGSGRRRVRAARRRFAPRNEASWRCSTRTAATARAVSCRPGCRCRRRCIPLPSGDSPSSTGSFHDLVAYQASERWPSRPSCRSHRGARRARSRSSRP